MNRIIPVIAALGPGLFAGTTVAVDNEEAAADLGRLSILGRPGSVDLLPGSAHRIDARDLATFEHADAMRVLRAVPGVYLQEEDGTGLRPNIGIRGSGLDRSARIALLEDGVLIAPAPYAAPAAYYFPTQRRMNAVEVLKGAAAIKVGPRTTGGALNLVSTPLPTRRSAHVDVLGGTDGFAETHAWYGDATERVEWLVETVQQRSDGFKQLDGGGNTGYDVRDYLGKVRFHIDASERFEQSLQFKLGYTDHASNETYLGLTDEDFATDPLRRYAASANDRMRSRHRQHEVRYLLAPRAGDYEVEITAYNNEFSRNWYKLERVNDVAIGAVLNNPTDFSAEYDWLRGLADSPADALTLRNNKRRYFSRGLQGVARIRAIGPRASHAIDIGVRFHDDEEDRFQDEDGYAIASGQLVRTDDGAPGSQSNRLSTARARSIFVEDQITAGAWEVTPGLRYETIELERQDFGLNDPQRRDGPTALRTNRVNVLIAGVGATRTLAPGWRALGGVHRGFNPPAPGSAAAEETSTNVELGLRYRSGTVAAELIGFYTDYSNLVGTCTVSTGGDCEPGEQFDGGAATVGGLEATLSYQANPAPGFSLPLRLVYTATPRAEFDTSFDSGFGPWSRVNDGDRLPYIAEHQLQGVVGLHTARWSADMSVTFVDATRTQAGQGPLDPASSTDAQTILDLAGSYRLNDRFELFARVDNALDRDYVVARRPAGVRPNKPRTAVAGFRFGF